MTAPPPGTGYFVGPTEAVGPGVLVLPSSWGLNAGIKSRCDQLADVGYTVLAPDLNDGALPTTAAEAGEVLTTSDMNVTASLVQSSARLLQAACADPAAPLAVIGYSSGASWALWLSARLASMVSTVVTFTGTQSIEMTAATATYLCHFATDDDVVDDLAIADMGLSLQQAKRTFRFEHHEGVGHGFAEPGTDGFNAQAEAVAWRQLLEFLAETHPAT